jgi:hypothetical protein
MRVFRVLHSNDGLGPYRARGCSNLNRRSYRRCGKCDGCTINAARQRLFDCFYDNTERMPIPEEDGMSRLLYTTDDDLFGFRDLASLKRWFGRTIPGLRRDGFVIAEFEVGFIRQGHEGRSGQVVFDIREAEFVAFH